MGDGNTENPGVYTEQISIAPRYHEELLDEAKATGRTLVNIMVSRVEQHGELQAQLAKAEARVEEFAWLVELGPACTSVPEYFVMSADTELTWTRDANLALRLSREEDAKAIIEHHGWTEATAVEHGWPEPPEAQRKERTDAE